MFDDHIQKPGNQPAAPGNLPVGEPEDMFSSEEETSVVAPEMQQPIPPADIPNQDLGHDPTPGSALQAGILRPAATSAPVPPTTAPVMPSVAGQASSESQPMVYAHESGGKGKIALIIIIILLLLGGIAWVVYNKFFVMQKQNQPLGTESQTKETQQFERPPVTPEPSNFEIQVDTEATPVAPIDPNAIDDSLLFGQPIDTDGDGLDDTREVNLGTDEKNWDTDGDELSDGDEVIIWKTNPLNPDTDGDTYKDGAEVRSGYSPNGPGKLFEPPVSP